MGEILLQQHDYRASVTISHPERNNAMSQDMWRALADVLTEVTQKHHTRVVVLRGNGGTFCAGADISEFASVYRNPETASTANGQIATALDILETLPIPTIAAIEGPCMGGGCALALACDLQIATTDAAFSINPTALGIAYSFRDCQRLATRIGVQRTKDLLLGGRRIDAATALSWGLITDVVESAQLDEILQQTVASIASRSPDALRRVKSMLGSIDRGTTRDTEALQKLFADSFTSADSQEGASAFMAKRKPRFQ